MPDKLIYKSRSNSNDLVQDSIDINQGLSVVDAGNMRGELDKWFFGGGGTYHQQEIEADGGVGNPSVIAQKTTRAILVMKDAVTGKEYKEYIRMPNLAKSADGATNPAFIVQNGLTIFNPAHADWATFKAIVDAHAESSEGNSATLELAYVEE